MKKFLIFGGTLDGRMLAEKLADLGYLIDLCVATKSGNDVLGDKNKNICVLVGRLTPEKMQQLMSDNDYELVIDATHPYATEVTQNIKKTCKIEKYIRLLRKKSEISYGKLVDSIEKACEICHNDNILLTTGSKEIAKYANLFDKNIYARVLPTEESIDLCKQAGLSDDQIITHMGVCSYEQNVEIIRKYDIQTLITKDGGKTGGFYEKYQACMDENIELIIINRPTDETGFSLEQIINMILESNNGN